MTEQTTEQNNTTTTSQAAIEKEYTFILTKQEAVNIVIALKKFPMEQVEGIVSKLETQFVAQAAAESNAAAAIAATATTQQAA